MSTLNPPRLASWLLRYLGPAYCREALIGDLLEEYAIRQSRCWYWREVCSALLQNWHHLVFRKMFPLCCAMAISWVVLTVCLWSADTIALRWIPTAAQVPTGSLVSMFRWPLWLLLLGVAHAAAGGVTGRVSPKYRLFVLVGLLLSVLDWKCPITGRLMLHILVGSPSASRAAESGVEFLIGLVGIGVGLRISKGLASRPLHPG